jgi:hypothetical protein
VALAVWLRISFSKRSPQVWQMYSYSGIAQLVPFL